MKPMMINAKKELLKELIKSMQAKMLESSEESPEMAEEECGCEVEGEEEASPGEGIDVMEVLNGKDKPVKPKAKVTIAMLGTKLSQMKPPFKKK